MVVLLFPTVAVLLSSLFALKLTAQQPLRLGDLDADAVPTVIDLQRLINHLSGSNVLAAPLLPYADISEDGFINTGDLALLRDAILGLTPLPNPFAAPVVSTPVTGTNGTNIRLTGVARPNRTILVNGGLMSVQVAADGNGLFTVNVPLQPNRVNNLFLTASNGTFTAGIPRPLKIIQDSQPPSLFIDFPADGQTLFTSNVVMAGRVGDMLSGFMGLTVTLGSQPSAASSLMANVNVGIGNNGTFERGLVPLAEGTNLITVTAADIHGNTTTRQITVHRSPIIGPRLIASVGDMQMTNIGRRLAQPISVRVETASGAPFANKLVNFQVTRSDGRLLPFDTNTLANPGALTNDITRTDNGLMVLQLFTDANGEARAWWTLGGAAGCGNNRVCVTSAGISNNAYFCASAQPNPARQINIGSGNNQRVEAGGPATEPLRAWVSDSCNGVEGILVTFRVVQGGGKLFRNPLTPALSPVGGEGVLPSPGGEGQGEGGTNTLTITTTRTGHAEVNFLLGPAPGNNLVEATFPGSRGSPAAFVLRGVARLQSQPTTFSGLVLDNSSQPIGGAHCLLATPNVQLSTFSDAQGHFSFTNVPAGPAHLHMDGLTATSLNGQSIPQGSYPALGYAPVLVPNANNSLPMPVLLPRLNPNNARAYDGTSNLVLTCEGIAGLKMTVQAGSMRKPDGSLVSPQNPAIMALNQVHHDDVPMPMPDGAAPPFAWTLQPGGATFDPPIQIQYPNMSGLPAGGIAYFLSFNHDTERFEIVASGYVLDDSTCIVTDPGAGLNVAGWGCNCPPYSVTGECEDCTVESAPFFFAAKRVSPSDPPCECENCTKTGNLSGGSVIVTKDPVCLGETITFTASGVMDSGGEGQCADGTLTSDPPVAPTYEWKIERDGVEISSGMGPIATITPTDAGIHTCTFTANAQRLCPPPLFPLPPKMAAVVEVMSLTAEHVTSMTDVPGDPETLYVPMGMPGDTITITAAPNPGGPWPVGQPVWTGAMGVGPMATLPIDKTTMDAGILVQATCGTSIKALKVVVWNIGYREFMPCWGLDPTNQPWLMVPNGGNNMAYADIVPPGAAPKVEIKSANAGTATVAPAMAGGTPQVVTVTGVMPVETRIEASSGGMRKAITNLNISVKNRRTWNVVIHAVTEENDDVQIIAPGAGMPGAICVSAGPNGFLDTLPAVDDVVTGTDITTGPNGVCDTMANNVNIPPANVPSVASLQMELDKVWLQQANVKLTVAQSDFTFNYDLDRDGACTEAGAARGPEEDALILHVAGTPGDFHVFYVNRFAVTGMPLAQAATSPIGGAGIIAVSFVGDTHINSPENITAHELGHALGLAMYEGSDPLGVMFINALRANPCEVNYFEWNTVNR